VSQHRRQRPPGRAGPGRPWRCQVTSTPATRCSKFDSVKDLPARMWRWSSYAHDRWCVNPDRWCVDSDPWRSTCITASGSGNFVQLTAFHLVLLRSLCPSGFCPSWHTLGTAGVGSMRCPRGSRSPAACGSSRSSLRLPCPTPLQWSPP